MSKSDFHLLFLSPSTPSYFFSFSIHHVMTHDAAHPGTENNENFGNNKQIPVNRNGDMCECVPQGTA